MSRKILAPSSICVLRLSAIGDVCHALSAVQRIQATYPECKVTWVMGKIEAQLLGDLPNIRVVVFDKKQGFAGMRKVWAQLGSERFDYLLHMQVALRASLLTLGIKAKIKLGFSWSRARKEAQWLFTNKKLPATQAPHVLDNFAQFADFLGCKSEGPSWFIPLSEQDLAITACVEDKPFIVISPAASKDERNWLAERYAQVADFAHEKGYQVVLCGGPTEREQKLADEIVGYATSPLLNWVGKTTLKQLTAVLRKATVVIAPDSGPAHIATTQGTPVIGLYAHSNPNRTGPYNSLGHTVSVYEQVTLEQYGKRVNDLPWGTRVKGKDLMARISVEAVIEQLEPILVNSQSILSNKAEA
ncbi:lipopolysaccharide heptosyltransferase family protein [Vibrio sinensis]|uniref:Lipopolysaccharide heptosyltransferase family protein n=1 Tax=Vibrio sinensis TaxID=2302434 RepID=A0A3A6R7D1_9VIBR|nr:glycosyltransferase family 9 protein [Vibrio sinensis]RJX72391.1 lipopolysaccharide heptosyltransferase family protein [Vibrio sinensis]